MKKNLIKKTLVIGFLILFVWASVIPLIGAINNFEKNENIQITQTKPIQDEKIIFFDNFDDNQKDFDKWTEFYTDGIWEEKNQRCEFQMYEPGNGHWNEGIKSNEFIVPLNPVSPVIINWDIICDIVSTNWAGGINLKITDGTNWLRAAYSRWTLSTMYVDSNDEVKTYLNINKPYGTYSNKIQLFSDRYIVTMDTDTSGPIYDSLFKPGIPLTINIYIGSGGEQPWLYFRSGFDNVKVSFEEPTTKKVIIFGRIENLNTSDYFAVFDAVKTRVITFIPFSFNTYTSGETLVTFGSKIGILKDKFALGFFNMAI